MILEGNQRGGGRQMALHLLNTHDNEHVEVHEISGFLADDVLGAFNEIHAISKGTQCKQYMYSLSLNPPKEANAKTYDFEKALAQVEKNLGLEDQPRVVVFHEKEGRRHAHCVWSRIDAEKMIAVNMSHDHYKLKDISKSLYLEHGWRLPEGFLSKNRTNPLNFTREEMKQAERINRSPAEIKEELQIAWNLSDCKASFQAALGESGYFLARGDRRGYVAIDVYGEAYPLNSKKLNRKKEQIAARLGDPAKLPSVTETKAMIGKQLGGMFKTHSDQLEAKQKGDLLPLLQSRTHMTKAHKDVRQGLEDCQNERWREEEGNRATRIRKGFKGLLDKLNGRYWKTRKVNEREAYSSHLRDRQEKDKLIRVQLAERQELQLKFEGMREQHIEERRELLSDLSRYSAIDHAPKVELPIEPEYDFDPDNDLHYWEQDKDIDNDLGL
ncbi:MAG: relaxase/mobilization nuclease domain-containing protein [Alphaproteobacteria bacterium]